MQNTRPQDSAAVVAAMPALTPLPSRSALRRAIAAATRRAEPELLPALLDQAEQAPDQAAQVQTLALQLARGVRERALDSGRSGLVQSLLQEFALSSQEGVALMCLAEALLRIPDAATRDALIRDKIGTGDWQSHLGQSPSLFVNAATWGLLLTGKLVATHSDSGLSAALRRALGRGGEPLIRVGVDRAMRLMGEQFVTGETIHEALNHARAREAQGFRYSYDMLGEAAMTEDDAQAYTKAYEDAIEAIGHASAGRGIYEGPGISIKLSALHPRYHRAQQERVQAELYPRLLHLAQRARAHDIGLNIDAEESERLDISLDLLERLCFEPSLARWNGIGFVVQAYQKRCPALLDFLIDLAGRSQRRLMLRLVKGAYWDSEIKRAQQEGQSDYPVYTRKVHTDVAYIACARKLLAAPQAVYPQFATHNAHTMAAVAQWAGPNFFAGQYEFQCLHGMGEPLYEQVVLATSPGALKRPCRVYAPVGTHKTLLAYLVRRLLENGANTSFVNRIADASIDLKDLVQDPVLAVRAQALQDGFLGAAHPAIPLPSALFGAQRRNARGLDLNHEPSLAALQTQLCQAAQQRWVARPLLGTLLGTLLDSTLSDTRLGIDEVPAKRPAEPGHAGPGAPELHHADPLPPAPWALLNPADRRDTVGQVTEATLADVDSALACAQAHAPAWAAVPPAARAHMLELTALDLEANLETLVTLLVREAGKTCANAVAEVREAVDFLRFDAAQLRAGFDPASHQALGPVVCISPWNFPLAIFMGQVAAALAAGNTVLAKPAEQTPLIATWAVQALHRAGVPRAALQLLPGRGETVGATLVADARVQGVIFTGSTAVARLLQQSLAQRLDAQGQPVTLVAETGGQNAMIVDSSALAEQVVADVLASAFDSAGQRCSALRVLCVQDDMAERLLAMLSGALRELRVGDPRELATDIGPVIDADAQTALNAHIDAFKVASTKAAAGHAVPRALERAMDPHHAGASSVSQPCPLPPALQAWGTYVAPSVIEIPHLGVLRHEVFGPVLHVLRYARAQLPELLAQIENSGYGLTLGVHSRIDETVSQVVNHAAVGNVYVNRNMVGAVVGVQPFGGEGLSGTGPKAGGPLYLLRLLARQPRDAACQAVEASGPLAQLPLRGLHPGGAAPGPGQQTGLRTGLTSAAQPSPLSEHADLSVDASPLQQLQTWVASKGWHALAQACADYARCSPTGPWRALAGPTGEANLYTCTGRQTLLCLVGDEVEDGLQNRHDTLAPQALQTHQAGPGEQHLVNQQDHLALLAAALAVGSRAIWSASALPLWQSLPLALREQVSLARDWRAASVQFDGVIMHGRGWAVLHLAQHLAQRPGALVGLTVRRSGDYSLPLARLVTERSLSINTAAAGGNASLMSLG